MDCVVHVSAPRPSALRIIQRPRTSFSFSGKPQQQTQQTQPFGLQIWALGIGGERGVAILSTGRGCHQAPIGPFLIKVWQLGTKLFHFYYEKITINSLL